MRVGHAGMIVRGRMVMWLSPVLHDEIIIVWTENFQLNTSKKSPGFYHEKSKQSPSFSLGNRVGLFGRFLTMAVSEAE